MNIQLRIDHITHAILRGDAYFNGIKLPKGQTAGTLTQQHSYAKLKAQQLVAMGL